MNLCGFCCEVTPDEADPNQAGLAWSAEAAEGSTHASSIQLQHVATRYIPNYSNYLVIIQSYGIPVSNSGLGYVGKQ